MKQLLTVFASIFFTHSMTAQEAPYAELMKQDWPDLKKYEAANRKILESGITPRVVFMGNSITEVWADQYPEFFSDNNFAGRGISGQTTPQMLLRFTRDVLNLKPEAVVILGGTNDIAGNTGFASTEMITDNIRAMAQLATVNNIKVILCSVLPVYDYRWRPGLKPVKKIAAVNSWMKEYAKANNHTYINYFDAMVDEKGGMKKEYSEDGVHPNDAGYQIMEPLVLEGIKEALGKS